MRLGRRAEPGSAINLPIETPRLVIREFVARDLEAVHAYSSLPEVTRFLVWGPNTLAESKQAVRAFLNDQTELFRTNFDLAIWLKGSKRIAPRLIGAVGLKLTDGENRTGDIGYALDPAYWWRAYVLGAAHALMGAGFSELELQRITASCDQRNKASARVMEKLGMRREGTFRRSRYIQGDWRDEYLYAILAEEFLD